MHVLRADGSLGHPAEVLVQTAAFCFCFRSAAVWCHGSGCAAGLGPEGFHTELALLLNHACCMLWWQGPEDPLVGPSDLCC